MDLKELDYFYNKFKYGEDNFHNLMQYRVRKILLISTFYDAYIFEHDSKLADQIVGEYHQLNLTTVPRMVSAPTGKEALRKLEGEHFDLVITTMRIGEISPFELADKVKEISPDTAVLLLLTGKTDINLVNRNQHRMENIENVFLWNGNSRLFLAMIKYIEDKRNVTQRLIAQELNDNTKYHRMRTRPKVLLARTYEEAVETTNRFKDYLLGIISDVEFTHGGEIDREAGFNLLKTLREEGNDVPVLLQSSDRAKRETAERLKVQFLYKRAPTLLAELRHFILSNLGFGDFVFKDEGGQEISRAHTLKDFESIFPTVPIKSLLFHASNDHFSGWLTAHGEFQVARRIKPVKVSDFGNPEDMRTFLTDIFKEVREQRNRGKIVDFDESVLQQENVIVRIGSGSLGGKGRGLAFFNTLLVTTEIAKKYGDIRIQIPRSSIIGTQEFDLFMQENDLENIHHRASDEEIKKVFLQGQAPCCPLIRAP
jgi:CheY-like chemotaxis protein